MNMKKEYRAELKQLNKAGKKLSRDLEREIKAAEREREAITKKTARRIVIATARVEREAFHINRRIAVLEGRLS